MIFKCKQKKKIIPPIVGYLARGISANVINGGSYENVIFEGTGELWPPTTITTGNSEPAPPILLQYYFIFNIISFLLIHIVTKKKKIILGIWQITESCAAETIGKHRLSPTVTLIWSVFEPKLFPY